MLELCSVLIKPLFILNLIIPYTFDADSYIDMCVPKFGFAFDLLQFFQLN